MKISSGVLAQNFKNMGLHIFCVLDRMAGHVSIFLFIKIPITIKLTKLVILFIYFSFMITDDNIVLILFKLNSHSTFKEIKLRWSQPYAKLIVTAGLRCLCDQ